MFSFLPLIPHWDPSRIHMAFSLDFHHFITRELHPNNLCDMTGPGPHTCTFPRTQPSPICPPVHPACVLLERSVLDSGTGQKLLHVCLLNPKEKHWKLRNWLCLTSHLPNPCTSHSKEKRFSISASVADAVSAIVRCHEGDGPFISQMKMYLLSHMMATT